MPFDLGGFGQDVGMAGISAGLDALGAGASARSQYHYQKRLYKHRYQWQTKDMIKAGINPMLSAMTGAPGAGSASGADFSQVGSRAASAFQASRMARVQSENVRTNTQLQEAQRNKEIEIGKGQEIKNTIDRASPDYQNALKAQGPLGEQGPSAAAAERYSAQTAQIKSQAETAANEARRSGLAADIARQDLTIKEIQAKYADELGRIQVAYQAAMKAAAQAHIPAAQADAAFWSGAGELGKWASFVKDILGHNN